MIKYTCSKIEELESIAVKILLIHPNTKVFAFYGPLGVGKTTFIKAFCKVLNIKNGSASPTFSIINEYETFKNEKVYHFDFYRVKDIKEIYDLGYEDYFYSDSYCFIEWPEKAENLLPYNYVVIKMSEENEKRVLEITEF
ncbi:MAG: tRNA (adenosine(37)-N6)-threonylcarbamoyltransferase complex ATPase subunit type 1 TsaE [Bacteroidales bacterium]|nr:tRNA (adenosine(37)-N6)-threonylcarbamoyltransferase complex ATPase subunit type 1 TsaE [Bacteroidales bacterium]